MATPSIFDFRRHLPLGRGCDLLGTWRGELKGRIMKESSNITNKILLDASLYLPWIYSLGPKCFLPQFDSSKKFMPGLTWKHAARSASKLSFPSFLHHLLKLIRNVKQPYHLDTYHFPPLSCSYFHRPRTGSLINQWWFLIASRTVCPESCVLICSTSSYQLKHRNKAPVFAL